MTHDELLAKINGIKPLNSPAWNMQNALRVVVELHKPVMEEYSRSTNGAILYAERCSCGRSYPCPEIMAIEKELK